VFAGWGLTNRRRKPLLRRKVKGKRRKAFAYF